MPLLREYYEELDHDKFEIVGINLTYADSKENAINEIDKHDINYPMLFDEDGDIGYRYRISGVPTIVIIDPDGKVVTYQLGAPPIEFIEEHFSEFK